MREMEGFPVKLICSSALDAAVMYFAWLIFICERNRGVSCGCRIRARKKIALTYTHTR